MIKTVKGFCPTLNKQYSIMVEYEQGNNCYIQTSADCEYLSFDFKRCPVYKDCPLRALAPKSIPLP